MVVVVVVVWGGWHLKTWMGMVAHGDFAWGKLTGAAAARETDRVEVAPCVGIFLFHTFENTRARTRIRQKVSRM